jgi:hypothetical protein
MGLFDNVGDSVEDIVDEADDVADEVVEGDLGGAVDEAGDAVDEVTGGEKDSKKPDETSDQKDASSPENVGERIRDPDPEPAGDTGPGFDVPEPDTGGGGGGSTSSPDPVDTGDSGSSSGQDVPSPSERLRGETTVPSPESLPDTQEEAEEAREFREDNPILQNATPTAGEALDARETTLETQKELRQAREKLQEAPKGSRIIGEGGEQLSRDEALDRVEDRQRQVTEALESQDETFSEFVDDTETLTPEQENIQEFRRERNTILRDPVREAGRDFLTEASAGNPRDAFREAEEELIIGGVATVDQSARFGDRVSGTLEDAGVSPGIGGTGFFEESAETLDELGVQGAGRVDRTTERFEREVTGGVTAGPGTAAGLATAFPGAFSKSSRSTLQDLGIIEGEAQSPNLGEGAAAGFTLTAEEAREDPVEFFGEELGEEVGEAAGGFLIGGPAGAAATAGTPTPEITPSIDAKAKAKSVREKLSDISLETRKGAAAPVPDTPGDDATPEFVRDVGPGTDPTSEIETETTGRDIRPEKPASVTIETPTSTQDSSTGLNRLSSPVLEDSPSRPQNISESIPRSEAVDEASPNILVDTKAEATTESDVSAEVFAESTVDTKVDTRTEFDLRAEPRAEPDTKLDFETRPEEDNGEDNGESLLFSEKDTEFQSSVGAEILGVKADEKPGRLEVQDPTSLRPIIDEENDV